jgi:hypothetical protein
MAGMTLEIENDQLIFTEVEDGPPVQRRWTVPPEFSVSIPGVPNELSVLIPNGRLGFFQKNGNGDDMMPLNFLVASFERGFGRQIQAVSLAGKLPSPGAQALFLETGNISDLGIGQNTLHTNAHITRESYREEYHTLTFRGGNGAQIQMPFISERIDVPGRKVTIPPSTQNRTVRPCPLPSLF